LNAIRLQFRCTASDSNDKIWVDNVLFEGHSKDKIWIDTVLFEGKLAPRPLWTGCEEGVDCGPECINDNYCQDYALSCVIPSCENDGTCRYDESSCEGIFELTFLIAGIPEESSWVVVDECDGNKVVLNGGPWGDEEAWYEREEIGNSRFTLTVKDSFGENIKLSRIRSQF
jgi:hypothetical protein